MRITKSCTRCGLEKSIDKFHNNKRSEDGKHHWCKDCTLKNNADYYSTHKDSIREQRNTPRGKQRIRRQNLKRIGVVLEFFQATIKAQDGKCAMPSCRVFLSSVNWAADHDHETGNFRGVLCQRCNLRLGWYEKTLPRHAEFAAYRNGRKIRCA